MKHIIILSLLLSLFINLELNAQTQGKVTFVTSNSVYVRFDNTEQIEVGDTLSIIKDNGLSSCLVVKNKSSTSCACTIIEGCEVKVNDAIQGSSKSTSSEPLDNLNSKIEREVVSSDNKERIRGRISAASYSTISSIRSNTHRTMYRLALDANHINNSKFSFQTHLNYRQNFIPNDRTTSQKKNLFNIYSMSIKYELDSTTQLTLGRRINNKVVSLGAIDGLQVEKLFGIFYAGAIVGFRPDIFDNGINTDLFQFGAYLGLNNNGRNITSQSTVGLLEQTNAGATDRRYIYFQNSSTINNRLNLFSTMELDLFNQVNGVSVSSARLTNLFLSARYKINKAANVTVSYDTRKRILYYETFRTEIEQLLADDDTRQQVRIRLSIRPLKHVNAGIGYSRRFQNNSLNKSAGISGYISMSKVPNIGGRLTLNFNSNQSTYLRSNVVSLRHSRSLARNKLNADFYFRFVDYDYLNRELKSNQKYFGASFSYNITKGLLFSVLGEMAVRPEETTYRINTKIIKRFKRR